LPSVAFRWGISPECWSAACHLAKRFRPRFHDQRSWPKRLPAHQRESLRDNRRRGFDDRRRGFALADVIGVLNVAPISRPRPYRTEIVIGLGRIKIARIESDAVVRSQFAMIVVSDVDTATRPAFGSFYGGHLQVGGPRPLSARQQTSCGRNN